MVLYGYLLFYMVIYFMIQASYMVALFMIQ